VETNMQEKVSLSEMILKLLQVEDETWGLYAFSRELLNKRIQPEQKPVMIAKAIACGKEYAQRIIQECGCKDIRTISEKLKLKIELHDTPMIGKQVLFARYTTPDKIEVMEEPVRKAVMLISQEVPNMVEHFQQNDIMDTILGHELFHFVEEQNVQKIYTRTEKILLWNFLGFKNYSAIRTLGEIGAMAFSKELNGLNYSPFLLDVLLYYGYDSVSAEKIYRDVLVNEVRKV
jgi:hypothetical protein